MPPKIAAGSKKKKGARTGCCRAPGNPYGYFVFAGRFDNWFPKIPKIARFDLDNFCRGVPRAKIRRVPGSPVRVAGCPAGYLIISPLRMEREKRGCFGGGNERRNDAR